MTETDKKKSKAEVIKGEGLETLKVIKMSGLGGGTVLMREIGAGGDGEVAGEMGMGGGGDHQAEAEVGDVSCSGAINNFCFSVSGL